MDPLAEYRAKRDAARTPEPVPEAKPRTRRGRKPIFVVQEHRATALHWDFRLERDGVLVSWALPKGVPTDPERNHLAVRTEDHPLEYADFTGRIPRRRIRRGNLAICDRGTYAVEKWTDDEVKVELTGERLSGRYTLFRTGGSDWMIHREQGQDPDFAAVPDDLRPMLAIPGTAPAGAGWACEFKWDGIRALCRVEGGRARLRSRNGNDLSETYPELKPWPRRSAARSCCWTARSSRWTRTARSASARCRAASAPADRRRRGCPARIRPRTWSSTCCIWTAARLGPALQGPPGAAGILGAVRTALADPAFVP